MFTVAAVFLVLVILLAFLIQASNKAKTDIEISNIRTKTVNSFLDTLTTSYLPDALRITIANQGDDPDYLNLKITEIRDFALRTGITFYFLPVTEITTVGDFSPGTYVNASYEIEFNITTKDITYQNTVKTIEVKNVLIPQPV